MDEESDVRTVCGATPHTREFNAHASVETVQKSLRNDLHAAETAKRPKDA